MIVKMKILPFKSENGENMEIQEPAEVTVTEEKNEQPADTISESVLPPEIPVTE